MSTKRQWFTAFVGAGHARHAAVGPDYMHLTILCGDVRRYADGSLPMINHVDPYKLEADGSLPMINHVDPYKLEAVTCKRCIAQLAMGPSGPKD